MLQKVLEFKKNGELFLKLQLFNFLLFQALKKFFVAANGFCSDTFVMGVYIAWNWQASDSKFNNFFYKFMTLYAEFVGHLRTLLSDF